MLSNYKTLDFWAKCYRRPIQRLSAPKKAGTTAERVRVMEWDAREFLNRKDESITERVVFLLDNTSLRMRVQLHFYIYI